MSVTAARLGGRPEQPVLVLGPSLGTSARSLWGAAAEHLADHFQVLAWDLPGHGHNRAEVDGQLSMRDLARAVLDVVDATGSGLHPPSFHYAGDSIGGAVGLQLLLDAPDRLLSATLLCTGARIGTAETWRERIEQVGSGGTAALADAAPARWFAPGFRDREPARTSALLGALSDADDAGYLAACAALASFDVRDRLGRIGAPVLAVAGAHDAVTPRSDLEEIAAGVQRGRLVVLPDAAHLAPAEDPVRVAGLIREHALGPPRESRAMDEPRQGSTSARPAASVSRMTTSHVYAAGRTPFGRFGGALSGVRADDLAAAAVRGLLDRAPGLDPAAVDDVLWGCANQAGEDNRNVGRMAVLLAGLPTSVPASTVNRLCGSSLDAAMQGSRAIETGDADIVLSGGVESMTRAPWVLPKPERPFPAGDTTAVSTALGWRLVNQRMPQEWTASLGECNEQLQERFGISRERQDEFAARSHQLAEAAWEAGHYDDLMVPVGGVDLARDEGVRPGSTAETLAALKPVFRPAGTITAGNASPLSDGASAVLLGSERASEVIGTDPIARVAGRGVHALDPQAFGFAPVLAAERALARAGIGWGDVGAVELNEAFAVQSLACLDAWGVDPEIVNAWGGAIAIGHPLGASGTRVLGTLAARLRATGARWGVAAICIGVGQALAVVLEKE